MYFDIHVVEPSVGGLVSAKTRGSLRLVAVVNSQTMKHLVLHLNGNVNWQHAQQQLLLSQYHNVTISII